MKQKPLVSTLGLALSVLAMNAHSATAVQDIYYPLLPGDPLVGQQWYLQNTGQNAFSLSGGLPSVDLNLDFTAQRGIYGTGVTIAVIDDGLAIHHPDLAGNIKPGSKNFLTGSNDPTPTGPDGVDDAHGTSVAGIAAAVGFNGIGGRGIAPRAGLKGYNWLLEQSLDSWMYAHGKLPNDPPLVAHTDARIFNQSYGAPSMFSRSTDLSRDLKQEKFEKAYEEVTRYSHWGRGAFFVKSAGNDYKEVRTSLTGGYKARILHPNANEGLPMQDAGLHPDNTNFWNIVVSALNANGVRSSYSTVGASVLVTAPGGEFGTDSPAMVTTDLPGCNMGYNVIGNTKTPLHGGNATDPECNYNSVMNGTSSAAPSTSGSLAVIASANPALNWRDVRHIMINTARKVDANQPGVNLTFKGRDGVAQTYAALPGWQTNAAGLPFHNWYGFGLIDIDRAVEAALQYNSPLPALKISEWKKVEANAVIPDATLAGVESRFVQNDALTVEGVQVQLNVDHTRVKDLAVELISPSGTRSVILTPRTGLILEKKGFSEQRLLSNHFYGEQARGEWTLRIIDTNGDNAPYILRVPSENYEGITNQANNAVDGLLKSWSIRFFGH